jgi:NTP pyrophosphatase (non-canonical NTP hydrolase)
MNIQEYQSEIERTCPQLGSELGDQLHMAIGIATEAGELLDAYKKRYAYNKPLDAVNIGEEIGDVLWYTINLCRMLNLNPEEIMYKNILKLRQRYPEKFTEENAINRNLDKERKILES